jgi:zinc transport system permease protein
VVSNKMNSLAGAIAHMSFGGIGLGYYLGINPLISAVSFTVGASAIIGYIQEKVKTDVESVIAMMWAVGMALGVLFIHFSLGYAPDLMSYIFGNILTVSLEQIYLMSILLVIIVGCVTIFFEKLKAMSFDEQFMRASGMNVFAYRLLLLALVSLSIISMIKLVGIILVIALLSIPAQIAKRFSSSILKMIFVSIILSLAFVMGGLLISFAFDLPSGATIVLLMGFGYLMNILSFSRTK